MNKLFKVLFLTCACMLITASAFAQYTEFIVEPGGSPTTYPDLTTAVATAQTFTGEHRIVIRPGHYTDAGVFIDHTQPGKIREIVGDGSDVVFFEGPATGIFPPATGTGMFLDVRATTGILITGLNISGYDAAVATWGAAATDLQFDDCIVDNCLAGFCGGAVDGVFTNLTVTNGWTGITLTSMNGGEAIDGNLIDHCVIQGMTKAPAIAVLTDDQFDLVSTGVAASADNNIISYCTITECSDLGILLANNGGTQLVGNRLENNDIFDVQFAAIWLMGTTNGNALYNDVYNCAQGSINPDSTLLINSAMGAVDLTGCSGVVVRYNTIYDNGGSGTMGDGGLEAGYANYGIAVLGGGSHVIRDNCLFAHTGVQGYDAGSTGDLWRQNYYDDLATNPAYPNYALDGGVSTDGDPWLYNNSAVGPSTVEVYNDYDVDINWTVPACDPFNPTPLAAYEFTVKWDPAFFTLNSYDYDESYLGDNAAGALYTNPTYTDSSVTFAATNFENPGVGDGRLAFLQLHAIQTGATQVTVASYYRDPNNVNIPTGSTPLNVTVVDTEAPTITVTVTDVLGYNTFGNNYPMTIQGDVADNYGLYRVYYTFDGSASWTYFEAVTGTTDTYGPFNPDISALSVGPHTLNLRVRDVSGIYGFVNHNFTIDNTGPVVSSVTLTDSDGCADAGYTSNELIDVAWTDDGTAVEYELGMVGWYGFHTYANPVPYTLPSTNGSYTIYVHLKDVFGNVGGYLTSTITLDKTIPNPTAAWLVSSPTPAKTNTTAIVGDFNMDVTNGTVYFKWSENVDDLDCGDAGWMAAPPAVRPFPITLSSGDGLKTVYMASKDAAGNVAYTSASITLDETLPALDGFAIHSLTGEPCASTNNFMAVYSFADADVVQLQYSWDDAAWSNWKALTGLPSPDSTAGSFSTAGNGWKKIYARLVDDIGNLGASKADSIYVDMTAPALSAVDIVDRAATAAAVVGNYSNETTVNISLTGLSADVATLYVTEDNWVTETAIDISAGQPFTSPYVVTYTYAGAFTECSPRTLGIDVADCAGNRAGAISDNIRFDLTAPDATAFTGLATTTVLSVPLNITASDNCGLYWMRITEDGSSVPPVWQVFSATPTFMLEDKSPASNDGMRRLHLEVADRAGNIDVDALFIDIDVDMTIPSPGAFTITSGNPLALAGYTNSLTGNTACFTPADADVTHIQIRNSDGTSNTGWVAVSGSYPECNLLGALAAGTPGPRTVRYRYQDDAGNISPYWDVVINYSNATPAAPMAITGGWVPGGSATLTWHSVPNAYRYYLRYNFMNEYPTYASPIPPSPATRTQGIPIPAPGYVEDTTYTFDGPQMDIYTMTIWALDAYGNYSAPMLDQMIGTNYRLGDHVDGDGNPGADGCLQFATDFGDLADAYNSSFGGTYFNDELDIAPTSDNSEIGYPMPDGAVDFEDLIIFSLNYRWSRQQPACAAGAKKVAAGAAATIASAVNMTVELPAYVRTGDQFTMPIKLDNMSGIVGYHLTFKYDHDLLEVVSVNPGQGYASIAESFFWVNQNVPDIDIHSAILSKRDLEGEELAVVTFRAVSSGNVTIDDELLDVRNLDNDKAEVKFSMTAKGGALPTSFALSQNYPNPFNPTTTIELALPVASQYRLSIYNILGQEVESFEGYSEGGFVNLTWDASSHSSGVYLYKVVAGDFTATRKMVLLK